MPLSGLVRLVRSRFHLILLSSSASMCFILPLVPTSRCMHPRSTEIPPTFHPHPEAAGMPDLHPDLAFTLPATPYALASPRTRAYPPPLPPIPSTSIAPPSTSSIPHLSSQPFSALVTPTDFSRAYPPPFPPIPSTSIAPPLTSSIPHPTSQPFSTLVTPTDFSTELFGNPMFSGGTPPSVYYDLLISQPHTVFAPRTWTYPPPWPLTPSALVASSPTSSATQPYPTPQPSLALVTPTDFLTDLPGNPMFSATASVDSKIPMAGTNFYQFTWPPIALPHDSFRRMNVMTVSADTHHLVQTDK